MAGIDDNKKGRNEIGDTRYSLLKLRPGRKGYKIKRLEKKRAQKKEDMEKKRKEGLGQKEHDIGRVAYVWVSDVINITYY